MKTPNHVDLHKGGSKVDGPSRGYADFEDFVYLLSHDFGNSVRALLELPHWIREDLVAEGHTICGPLAENFDLMETHTRRLDQMLIDLLAYSRVGRLQSVKEINLTEAVDLVIDQLPAAKGIEITCDLRCKSIEMGEQDILTLLSALISNAIKHHHQDSGAVHISSRNELGDCVIRIQDDGPGIPEKHRERVFEAMTTLKPRDEVEGSGMGLAIVRKIVEHYSGRLAWTLPDSTYSTSFEMRFKN